MLIYFTEITILHISCYYYEYRSYILIILMRTSSLKSSKYGISCTQMYYRPFVEAIFPCNSILRNRPATSQGLFHYDVGRIRITIRIRVVVLQKVRIWVMVRALMYGWVFLKKICVMYLSSREVSFKLEHF
jgi:hypothetical protein